MPLKTEHFKLEKFKRGSLYSAASDYRRFTTLDYNLESYVGIIGIGIISGWDLSKKSDLIVSISYGKGILNGFFGESPYSVKRRSQMEPPEQEIEIIRFDAEAEPYLTNEEKADYISIVQEYNPSYSNPDPIENTFIKTSIPYSLEVENDSDSYIYAELETNHLPYPALTDSEFLSFSNLEQPKEEDYDDFFEYLSANEAYNEQLLALYAYKWQTHEENRFTQVSFEKYSQRQSSPSKVYLGKVSARNGQITNINLDGVESLANMESTIVKNATKLIKQHKHRGSSPFDPPKIKLETDIREAVLVDFYPESATGIYNILNRNLTGISNSHKHSYIVDENGNGQTIEHIGNGIKHFHKIESFAILQNELSYEYVENHTHTLENEVDTWTEDNNYNVYSNGILIGNQDSSYISLNLENKQIAISNKVNIKYQTLKTEFPAFGEEYTFEKKAFSTYSFMYSMIVDFYFKYKDKILAAPQISPINIELINGVLDNIPEQKKELVQQCNSADKTLININDQFVFVQNVATTNFTVYVAKSSVISNPPKITLEIFSNTEVTGKLKEENILYIHADKFLTGEFDVARIPFISHIGRLKESANPDLLPMASENGTSYKVLPRITDANLDHYHTMKIDSNGNGETTSLMIGGKSILYQTENDKTFDIYHKHMIKNWIVQEAESQGFNEWMTEKGETETKHTHSFKMPVQPAGTSIYSVCEDNDGNIYIGSSKGLFIKPTSTPYCFVINGEIIYKANDDLWTALQNALVYYEEITSISIVLPEEYEGIISDVSSTLANAGDSYKISLVVDPNRGEDSIVVKLLDYIPLNQIIATNEKNAHEIEDTDTVTGVHIYRKDTGEEISSQDEDLPNLIYGNLIDIKYETSVDISNVPFWKILPRDRQSKETDSPYFYEGGDVIKDIVVAGGSYAAFNYNILNNTYKQWIMTSGLNSIGPIRQILSDQNNNTWIATESGLWVHRPHMGAFDFVLNTTPGTSNSIWDIIDINGNLIVASQAGIFSSSDQGKTWTTIMTSEHGFKHLSKDYAYLLTDNSGHYHSINVDIYGNGSTGESNSAPYHSHTIANWKVEETLSHGHDIIFPICAVEVNGNVYESSDNGATFTNTTEIPYSEFGKVILFSGLLFVATQEGIKYYDVQWNDLSTIIATSFDMARDLSYFYIGANNTIYSCDLNLDVEQIYSIGNGLSFPSLTKNGNDKNFNFCFSNRENAFYLQEVEVKANNESILSKSDYSQMFMENGAWQDGSSVEIFYNKKLVFSDVKSIDERGFLVPNFTIDSTIGQVDFSANTKTIREINIYDDSIYVESYAGFYIGDTILIKIPEKASIKTPFKPINIKIEDTNTYQESIAAAERVAEKIQTLEETLSVENAKNKSNALMYEERIITDIAPSEIGAIFYVNERFTNKFDNEMEVVKLPNIDSRYSIVANIYDNPLIDVGILSHEELEDSVSNITSGLPYNLNSSFLSNVLQLTQAVKYIYPNVDEYSKNMQLYDMHYSWDENDENYIGNKIDLANSEISSASIEQFGYNSEVASTINDIFIGTGIFSEWIFAATNLGLFISKNSDYKENDWWRCQDIDAPCYKIKCYDDILMLATENGLYTSSNMKDWELQSNGSVAFPIYDISTRFNDYNFVKITGEEIAFSNAGEYGVMSCDNEVFQSFEENREIHIDASTATTKNGTYFVISITPKVLTVYPAFSGTTPETDISVDIVMAKWWKSFNGDTNQLNPNLKNPYIICGKNNISTTNDPIDGVWTSAEINDIEQDFEIYKLNPLESGSIIATAKNDSGSYILKSINLGTKWSSVFNFKKYVGTVISRDYTEDGHTKIKVVLDEEKMLKNGLLKAFVLNIVISNAAIKSYSIIWNDVSQSGEQYIYLRGREEIGINSKFEIIPISINTSVEIENGEVIFGTSNGLMTDKKSIVNKDRISGTITSIGRSGLINSIDISGKILSVSLNNETGNVIVNISNVSETITRDGLIGKKLVVLNTSPLVSFDVISNRSSTDDNEISVEVNSTDIYAMDRYIYRDVSLSGDNAKISINLDKSAAIDEFKDGYAIVLRSDGTTLSILNILTNTSNEITLSDPVDWASLNGEYIRSGLKILLFNSALDIEITTNMNESVENYSLNGLTLETEVQRSDFLKNIYFNKNGLILLKYSPSPGIDDIMASLLVGDRFYIKGTRLEDIDSFQAKTTSIDEDHYHDINVIGKNISGEISSIVINPENTDLYDMEIKNSVGLDASAMSISEYLLKDEIITFTNKNNPFIFYTRKIYKINGNIITVNIGNSAEWKLTNNQYFISPEWNVFVESKYYGHTVATFYKDFNVYNTRLKATATYNTDVIYVNDTSEFTSGDKVEIKDTVNKSEINYIELVLDSTTLKLSTKLNNSYLYESGSNISILKDEFSNNHMHLIRKNMIETKSVSDYLNKGYALWHVHETQPFIKNITSLCYNSNVIFSAGNSSKIYQSNDGGDEWNLKVDLNNSNEGQTTQINQITNLTEDGGYIMAGAENGHIYFENFTPISVEPIIYPEI